MRLMNIAVPAALVAAAVYLSMGMADSADAQAAKPVESAPPMAQVSDIVAP